MRSTVFLALAAAALVAVTGKLSAQSLEPNDTTWRLGGLRTAFCVQFLMDPDSDALKELPAGYHPVSASDATDLHVALRGVVEGQPEFAAWSPARLCFAAADTVQTSEFTLADRKRRRVQMFGSWTVLAAEPGGPAGDVALKLFTSSDRLIGSARKAGHLVREARVAVGLVPTEDENGVPSSDKRFQVKVGKALITWDGPAARQSASVREPWRLSWTATGDRRRMVSGEVLLSPVSSRPMVGALKVEGKDAFAKALRASPTRFAGPAYQGGEGSIVFRK
jgi:hypothetical protein